jgi:hypothetical protein
LDRASRGDDEDGLGLAGEVAAIVAAVFTAVLAVVAAVLPAVDTGAAGHDDEGCGKRRKGDQTLSHGIPLMAMPA